MSFTPLFKDTEHENELLFLDCDCDILRSPDNTIWIRIEALSKPLEYNNHGALFVINNRAMLLRYEFGSWLPIFPNAEFPIEVFAAMQYITLSICIKGRREYTIPVHQVDKLPPLFSEDMLYTLPQKLRTALLELQTDKPVHLPSESLPTETCEEEKEEEEEPHPEVNIFTAAPSTAKKSLVLKYDVLAASYCPIIEALLSPLRASRLDITPHETNSIIAYDVEGHLLLIGVCDLQGTWEAEEYTTTSNHRWWNTEDCETLAPSPIYHLKHLSAHLKERTGVDAICALAISSHMTLSEPIETITSWSPIKAITFENYEAPGLIQSNAYFKALKKELRPTHPLDRVLIQTVLSTYEPPA